MAFDTFDAQDASEARQAFDQEVTTMVGGATDKLRALYNGTAPADVQRDAASDLGDNAQYLSEDPLSGEDYDALFAGNASEGTQARAALAIVRMVKGSDAGETVDPIAALLRDLGSATSRVPCPVHGSHSVN